jgi:hypothetical protein
MAHCMRQTVIALRLADLIGASEPDREATYYLGLMMNSYVMPTRPNRRNGSATTSASKATASKCSA